jgi:type 1 fimbria pilin
MKKLLCTSIAGLLIGNALPAFAASTTDLTVQGLIVPSACAPSLSKNGTIDLGRISAKDLNQDTRTNLTRQNLQLEVHCEAPTLFAMLATDNRADSGTLGEYGVGVTNAGERIGGFHMLLDKASADEAPVQPIASLNNGTTWFTFWEDDAWSKNLIVSIGAVGAARVPVPRQNTQMELTVAPFILATKNLTLTEDTVLDGSVTVTVQYL